MTPQISIVIPVFNEEEVLPSLFQRLYPALDALQRAYEVVFVNDGSKDRSSGILREQFEKRSDVTRVIFFNGNYGQHRAILAGFAYSRGRYVITLDADLQNPPEDIIKIVAEFEAGHDYVGTIRKQRRDVAWRRYASRLINRLRERTTHIRMTDQGCMFRGYARQIVDAINKCSEGNAFIPALGYTFAANPTEIIVGHEERKAGVSKYSLYRLLQLNFDLMTGFSVLPMQLFSFVGIAVSIISVFLVIYLFIRRLFIGPEAEGVFTLFAIAFLLIGVGLFGVGLLGEYVGRIYEEVRHRPRYLINTVLERPEDSP